MSQMRVLQSLLLLGVSGCTGACGPGVEASRVGTTMEGQSTAVTAASAPVVAVGERPPAPGFEGGTSWLNVERPLSIDDLRGHVVVVDFWTSCCINCLHTLPTLHALEDRFSSRELVVVGVHSPKFTAERDGRRLRDILLQYDVRHPIVVDGAMRVWDRWNANAWPTVIAIDTHGRIAWADSGEPNRETLFAVVQRLIGEGRADRSLANRDVPGLEPEQGAASAPLFYPTHVVPLDDGGFAVADTAHHRIVLLNENGGARATIGSGIAGYADGAAASARFFRPQGLTARGGDLYVADTENHSVRKVSLRSMEVSTVAGAQRLGAEPLFGDWIDARSPIRSPWDVLFVGDRLFVAMAGSHQIAEIDVAHGKLRRFAGSGREARIDGDLASSAFAQPSALATDGRQLFVLDSETSSVRAIDLRREEVRTVVGEDLFVFGDRDGDRDRALLQHPLGLAYAASALWVADTYNNKLKRVDPRTGHVMTVLANNGAIALSEPAGVSAKGDRLFIADTNNHRLVSFVIENKETRAWVPDALVAPVRGVALAASDAPSADDQPRNVPRVTIPVISVPATGATRVSLEWTLPAGTAVNEEAPWELSWQRANGLARTPSSSSGTGASAQRGIAFDVALDSTHPEASLAGTLDLVVCDALTHESCVPVTRTLELSFRRADDAPTVAQARIPLPSAR